MSVIGIQLDGDSDFLDTKDDTSIEITINNPLLGDAEVLSPGSYSLPFNLPSGIASPKNAAKLRHPDVIENNAAYLLQKAKLFLYGVPYKSGNIKSQSIGEKNVVSANFLFGLSQIDPSIKTARLRDVMDENVVIDASDVSKIIYVKKIVAGDWSVTVNDKNYTSANPSALAALINTDALTSEDKGVYVASADVELSAASPGGMAAPYLIIKSTLFYTLLGVHLTHDSVDPLVPLSAKVDASEVGNYKFESFDMTAYIDPFSTFLADYFAGTFPSDKYRFPVMFNASLYSADGNVTKESEIINACNVAGLIRNDWVALRNRNTIQPFVLLKYVLDKIASTFGFALEGDFYTDPAVAGIFIDNANTLDVPMDYIGDSKYVFWKRSFNVSDLVPDMTVIDFLKGIASRYNLGVYPNEQTQKVRIKYLENVAKSKVYNDITDNASPITNIEDQRVTGYNMVCEKDESDLFSITETLAIGVPQDTLNIMCGRLHQTSFSAAYDGILKGPQVSRKNNDTNFKLRVFHFLGMVSSGLMNYQGADISGATFYEPLADSMDSAGIHTRFWKFWLLFKKNWRVITLTVRWPLRKLLRFDYETKQRFDRNNYILSQMKVKVTSKSVQATEVQLLTMK